MNIRNVILLAALPTLFLSGSCKNETKKTSDSNLSVVVLNDTLAYYHGTLDDNAVIVKFAFGEKELQKVFTENKDTYKDRLHIILKFTSAIERSDQPMIAAFQAQKYDSSFVIQYLTDADKVHFNTSDFTSDPPEPVDIDMPTIVNNSSSKTGNPGFYIYLKKNNTIWFKTDSTGDDRNYIQLDKKKPQILEKAIADYKKECKENNKIKTFLVKGDSDAGNYKDFELVINALKKNEEYKYNLITEPE